MLCYKKTIMNKRNVIIIGSGPAGLTAAIYSARAELKPLVIAGLEPGGQLMLTSEVENFPGFESIIGPELMGKMRDHALKFGAEIINKNVTKVDFSKRPFRVWVDNEQFESDSIIVATGAQAKWLGLESETRLRGRGVSSCATCDGFFFKEKDVIVVGGGDVALEDANFLTRFASSVTIVHRRDTFRASKPMQRKIEQNPKIKIAWNKIVTEILGDNSVSGVKLKDTVTGDDSELKVQGVFVAIGHKPNTSIFEGQLDLNEIGYIKPNGTTATNIEGVFFAGDVEDSRYRQAITASGSGCMAAIDCEKWLSEQETH